MFEGIIKILLVIVFGLLATSEILLVAWLLKVYKEVDDGND